MMHWSCRIAGRLARSRVSRPRDGRRTSAPRRGCVENLERREYLAADIVINELLASNGNGLTDEDGSTPDWIELYNPGPDAVDLQGWRLTDDVSDRNPWVFPSVQLEADGYLVVFASGKDRAAAGQPLHTDFKLSAGGETVALLSPSGAIVSQIAPDGSEYPQQFTDISYGVTAEGLRYFLDPSPGEPNGEGKIGFVADTRFSVDRGFYDAPLEVEITTETPGATIRYTTDGSAPTETEGIPYTGPITISGTTTLRAAAFLDDYVPTNVDTQTYLFPDQVLWQDGSGLQSAQWGYAGPDWEIDPKIRNHPDPESRLVVDDLLAIPTVSLAMNFDEMFGDGGIYIAGEGVERATSVELIQPDGSEGFQIDGSVQIVGGSSTGRWKSDKLSMRLKFNKDFGSGKLKFPVFGDQAADRFDTLVLDAHLNNAWHYGGGSDARGQRGRAQLLRDAFVSDLQRATGGYAPHSKFVHLYIDGIYWGMHELHERPDDNFAASYLGGDNKDYDVIKHRPSTVVQGTNENYLALLAAANEDLSDPAKYQAVTELLDIDDFINYMLVNYYLGNTDWAHQNWYASRNRVDPQGRWRFHSWDAEKAMQNLLDNVVVKSDEGGPTGIQQRSKRIGSGEGLQTIRTGLITNPEYRMRFADRVHAFFFNDGLMTPAKASELYQRRLDEIDRAIVAESARWGDNRVPVDRGRRAPYTRGVEWVAERDRLLGTYFPQRTAIVLDQLRAAGLYPEVEAPELNQHGGQVPRSFAIELTAPAGTIYYTTDGSDPRLPGGALAPTAVAYSGPFQLEQSGTVRARVLLDGVWSALDKADFSVRSESPLRISEINFHPHAANVVDGLGERNVDNDQFEFVELVNTGDAPIDLGGTRLAQVDVGGDRQGIDFLFAPQTLAPGERVVVVRSVDAFQSRYGSDVPIAAGNDGRGGREGEFGGKLANGGERLTLIDADGLTIEQVDYGVDGPWPTRTAGKGSSLERNDPAADASVPENWHASVVFGGSPGAAGLAEDGRVVINEVLAAPLAGTGAEVELLNTTGHTIDVGQWYVAASLDDLFSSQLPAPRPLGAGAYRTFDAAELGLRIDAAAGGQLWLVEADASGRPLRFVDRARFIAAKPGATQGRWPDGGGDGALRPLAEATLGRPNSRHATPAVVISETHADPVGFTKIVEDFQSGNADRFTPISGAWEVADGRYHIVPQPGGDGVAVLQGIGPLPGALKLTTTVRAPSDTAFNKNGLVIFDYQGPTDFKFASLHMSSGRWRIGQRTSDGWEFLVTERSPSSLSPDVDVPVAVVFNGSVVTLWSGDTPWVTYDFGEPLGDGLVGLGTKGGEASFSDFAIEWLDGPQEFEFVELFNTADTAVDLDGWRLTGDIELAFPAESTVAPGETIVAVPFDPEGEPGMRNGFLARYGAAEGARLVGPYQGRLSGEGGRVELTEPPAAEDAAAGGLRVDLAAYGSDAPWPAAGAGQSLHRAQVDAPGDLPGSWKALPPTPGAVRFAQAGDLNLDGTVDTDDVAGFVLALADPSAYQQQYNQPVELAGDLDLDGDVDYDDIGLFVAIIDAQNSEGRAGAVEANAAAAGDAATLAITEWMASNGATLEDASGNTPDWIEIHNGGDQPVELLGWTLTDDPQDLGKWPFPYGVVGAGDYLVVFASGEDRGGDTFRLRSDYNATPDGTFLIDVAPGSYTVRLSLGDAERERDEVVVWLQGEQIETVSTAAGAFRAVTHAVASDGQIAVRLQDLGGTTARAAIGSLIVTPDGGGERLRFDFGTDESPVEPGFVAVTPATIYAPQVGYGWQEGTVVSSKDRGLESDELHTNFKLRAKGEYLALVSPDGQVVSEFGPNGTNYPPQETDISFGTTPDGPRFFVEPTPGAPNSEGQTAFVGPLDVSVDRGFFVEPFQVEIAAETPDATIRYTVDGSMPTETNGVVYTAPIDVTGTTTLRAAAFRPGFVPSPVETRTYLFPDQVLSQDGSGLESARWGHAGPDWEVDPEIVNHPDPESRLVVDDLLTIPTLSLVLDFDQMFGPGGIYISGEGVEIPTSVEMVDPRGADQFQADGSVQIVGGSSTGRWKSDKLSMRLKFNEAFGSGDLEYPVFGDDAASSFDTLVIDAHLNNAWNYGGSSSGPTQRGRAQYLRDVFTSDMQRATGGYATHDRFVQLYINGLYWGMHRLHERPDDNFAAAYLGGDNKDYDVIKHSSRNVVQGSNQSYRELVELAQRDLSDPAKYDEVANLLDIDDFINYMLVNFYLGNTDWAHQNWYASRNRVDPAGKWRFHSWDAEKVMQGVGDNSVRKSDVGGPTGILSSTARVVVDGELQATPAGLITNPEFRLRFADRVQQYFFNGGLMTPDTAASLYERRLAEIDRAIVGESARWGDNRREVPYTRGVEWIQERDRLLEDYFPRRTDIVLQQLRSVGLYPDVDAPALSRRGGEVPRGFEVALTAPAGTIYYTLDGSDPRLEGGAIAPAAIEYTDPIRLTGVTTIKARALLEGTWSALEKADFRVASPLPLRITEINFNPHDANLVDGLGERSEDNDRFEFIELMNTGQEAIGLSGVRLVEVDVEGERQGVSFQFAPQSLDPGERIAVVRDTRAFRSRYGQAPRIAAGDDGQGGDDGEYGGKLANDGERLTLLDAEGALIEQFTYGDRGPWPARADGGGSSLERTDVTQPDADRPQAWRPSIDFGGSPGSPGTENAETVVINEIVAAGGAGQPDRIELANAGEQAVDVGNWYLSDSADDYFQFQIPEGGSTIGAGGYRTLDGEAFGFSLDAAAGGALWLLAADDAGRPLRFVDRVEYRGSRPGQSQGRWPDAAGTSLLFPMTEATFGAANAEPAVGPVIVSEVHYRPTELPGYQQNFDSGTAGPMRPVSGTWNVEAGRYHAVADSKQDDAVALINAVGPLRGNVAFSATVRIPADATLNRNGVLVFDYHGPTDFKFASLHGGNGKWRIGRRDADGWHFLDTLDSGLLVTTDTDIPVTLRLEGTVASLFSGSLPKARYDFGEPLTDGKIGVASKGGEAFFDDLSITASLENDDLEFVELFNTSEQAVDLSAWRLAGEADYTFPAGTTLGAGETLLVVPFLRAQRQTVARFDAAYGVGNDARLFGPDPGALDDARGIVELLEPVGSPRHTALVDRAIYDSHAPWVAAAAGNGRSLQRSQVDTFGDLPTSWKGVPPTPGRALFAAAGDLDLSGTVDTDDIDPFVLALADPAAYEAAFDVPTELAGDLDGDGDVDYDDIAGMVARIDGAAAAASPRGPAHGHGGGRATLTDLVLRQETIWKER